MTTIELLAMAEANLWSALEAAQGTWTKVPEIARSLLSAALGVLFGTWVASRAQNKRLIVAELHALRGAHALCFAIINKALAVKKQHLRPMKMAYDAAFALITNQRGPLALQLDLRDLTQISFQTDSLEKLILDKCFLGSEAIATLVAVMDATDGLNKSIAYRNDQVVEFRKNAPTDERQKIALYLGLPSNGHQDERIKNNLGALLAQSDDCIFFGRRLAGHILRSENRLRRKNRWKYWLPGKKLKPALWAKAEVARLLPRDEDYSDWVSGFVPDHSFVEKRFRALKAWFSKRKSELT